MMKTIVLAVLKDGWHESIENLTEKAHNVLDSVDQILLYGDSNIKEAEKSIEDGYYVYLPPLWDRDFDDNFEKLQDFCELIKDLRDRAFPLTIKMSDIDRICVADVPEETHSLIMSVDWQDIRVNDIPAVIKATNIR